MSAQPKDGANGATDRPHPPHELTPADIAYAERIARAMAKKKRLKRFEDDMVSAAYVGLIDARDRFDPARGTKFKTYMAARVRGAILDFLRYEEPAGQRKTKPALERRATIPFSALTRGFNRKHDYFHDYLFELPDDDPESIEAIDGADGFEWLLRPFKDKPALMLDGYYRLGLPMKTIGEALGLCESSISQMHSQALQLIAERFRDHPELMENA